MLRIYRIEAEKIVEEFSDVFRGYGKFDGEVTLEIDDTVPPVIQQPRRVPIAIRPKLKAELDQLEKDGIVAREHNHTEWVSNILLVKRGTAGAESIRICLDPIPLNKALKRPNLQFVTLDEILPELGQAKVFSTVDARKGFWHVVLDEQSSKLTSFWTPFGRYRWLRLPFGISPAPEIFQSKLQGIVQDLSCFGLGVAVFQKDGIVGYASRTLTNTEKNYAQIEKELLAILFACVRFDQLIVGNPRTTVKTDHKPLINIFNKPLLTAPKRLQHMLLNLQRYHLEVEFVTGKENVVADAISRAPHNDSTECDEFQKLNIYKIFKQLEDCDVSSYLSISDSCLDKIKEATEQDAALQTVIDYIRNGWPNCIDRVPFAAEVYFKYRSELSTQDGLVFRNDPGRAAAGHVRQSPLEPQRYRVYLEAGA